MIVYIDIKDDDGKVVHHVHVTITKVQYTIFKHYLNTLISKFRKEA